MYLYHVVCSWCVVVDNPTLSPTKNREKIAIPLNGTHAYTCIMRTHARTRTYTGTLVCIIAPTHARTGAWVSEMRTFRKLKNRRNCSILTPTSHLRYTYTHLPTTIYNTHPKPLQTLDITTFSLRSHYILTYPCILPHTYAYNITMKHNPPIGGHGFRISTFSTSIMGTYRIPSETDPRTPLNLRLLFLVFTNLF